MKYLKLNIIVFLLVSQFCFSQTFTEQNNTTNPEFESIATEQHYLSSQNTIQATSLENNVFITQVGDNNVSNVTVASNDSKLSVTQNGNDNINLLNINSEKISQTVMQNGDNNLLIDYSVLKTQSRAATLIQNGNNNNLNIFGSNSLSEKIKVSMQGEQQTVIIRNF